MIGGSIALASNLGLVGTGPHPYTLEVGSIDYLTVPDSPPTAPQIPLDSIRVEEVGEGGIGSMEFDLWDPTKAVNLTGGESVRFHDNTEDDPLFGGTVESVSRTPAFGGQGRIWSVRCFDYNVILDRVIVPAEVRAGGLHNRQAQVQYFAGTYSSLRTFGSGPGVPNGTRLQPVGTMSNYSNPPTIGEVAIATGTLRSAIRQVIDSSMDEPLTNFYPPGGAFVDSTKGLRAYIVVPDLFGGLQGPNGTAPFHISDAPTGSDKAAEELTYEIDVSQTTNAVYVDNAGGPAAGTGWVRDSASIAAFGERQEVLNEPDSTTAAKRDAYGYAYLQNRSSALLRGSYTVSGTSVTGLHPGQNQLITNGGIGLGALTGVIMSVETTFLTGAGYRQLRVAWGGALPASMARVIASRIAQAARA